MTTEHPKSPLLQARLEFLGVVGRGDFNIFLEISNISGLALHSIKYKDHSKTESEDKIKIGDKSEPILEEAAGNNGQNGQSSPYCDYKGTCSNISGQEPGQLSSVFDRSSDAIIKQVPYTFKTNTLKVFDTFEKLKIPSDTEIYKPKQERQTVDSNIFYCKNLFLKDRKGQFFLVLCHEDYNMDLKQLRKNLNACRNFNFGTAEDMQIILGTEPGGVTPLALMNQSAADVKMVIHKSLLKEDASIMFHPLDANLATKITLPGLLRYLKTCNHAVTFVK